jgi:hypothetical protein
MSELANPVVWVSALAVVGICYFLFRAFFDREARERRRRARSHGKVVSKVARPMVKLAVEGETDKKD